MDKAIERLLQGNIKLPSIPAVAQQVLAMANNPNTSTEQLASVLSSDPAIASTILRYVNSAAYSPVEQIASIQRAIVALGFKEVTRIALTFSLLDSRKRSGDGGLDPVHLWQRSLISAIAAKAIGNQARQSDPEALFLAGLLQDIGMMGLNTVRPKLYEPVAGRQIAHIAIAAFEQQQLKLDHAKFGGYMLQQWGLPEKIVEAVARSHQTPFSREGESSDPFNTCVAISGIAADVFIDSDERAKHANLLVDLLKRGLGLDAEEARHILKSIQIELKSMAWVLEKLVANPEEIQALRVQAQQAIANLEAMALAPSVDLGIETEHDHIAGFDEIRNSGFLNSAPDFQDILTTQSFEEKVAQLRGTTRDGSMHLALLRIDNLRRIKELHGEKVATLLLKVIGRNIVKTLRDTDLVTRYGDVFAIILVNSTEDGSHVAMDRVLERFRGVGYSVGENQKVELIMSAGIAVGAPDYGASLDDAMGVALGALKAAHRAGEYEIVSHLNAA
jgi:diguanylate cyclase (GGDEF)-like protein